MSKKLTKQEALDKIEELKKYVEQEDAKVEKKTIGIEIKSIYDEQLRQELREGSEGRHLINRLTPDGKETVEAVPLDWAIEVCNSKLAAQRQALRDEVLAKIDEVEKPYKSLHVVSRQGTYFEIRHAISTMFEGKEQPNE